MNILHFVNFYNGGGSTKTCFEHVKNLSNHNHVFIGSDEGEYKNYFSQLGKSYTVYRDSNFNYPELLVKEIIRKNKIDLVHFYLPGHENPSFLRNIDLPKICTFLCGQKCGFDYDLFDHVRFISEYNKNLNEDSLPKFKSYSVIRCGLGSASQEFRPPRKTDNVTFGRISAFCPSKRLLDTLECAKNFKNNKFILAGQIQDQNYFNQVKSFIKENNLTNTALEVNITEQRKEFLYDNIDVLHYPTTNEAFCYSIVEGMQRSKSVISYYDSAIPELKNESELKLVETDNIEELISSTDYYIKNPEVSAMHGSKNRSSYEQHLNSETYSSNMNSLYERFS